MGVMMIAIGAGPIGFALIGATVEAWGAPTAVAANSVIGFTLLAGIVLLFPGIRRSQTFPDRKVSESGKSDLGVSCVTAAVRPLGEGVGDRSAPDG